MVFHNENGPDIGVTTCGVIVRDGLYFKDMDNSGELAIRTGGSAPKSAQRIWWPICAWTSRLALC